MITNRCNLKCKLCNIWREKSKDLEVTKLYRVLLEIINNNQKISCLGITGGEPFLLKEELGYIFRIIKPNLRRSEIEHFNVTTNGSFPLGILNFLEKIPRSYFDKISFNVSLDGLAKTHNYLRGKDIFKKVILTLNILKKFKVDTTLNFVINPFNSNQILDIYKLTLEKEANFELEVFQPNAASYYHYFNKVAIKGGKQNWRQQAAREIEKVLLQNGDNFNKKQLLILKDYLRTGRLKEEIIARCKTPSRLLFVRATGEIYSCPREPAIDKVDNFNYQEFLKRQKTASLKIKNRGCKGCLSTMGSLSYVG